MNDKNENCPNGFDPTDLFWSIRVAEPSKRSTSRSPKDNAINNGTEDVIGRNLQCYEDLADNFLTVMKSLFQYAEQSFMVSFNSMETNVVNAHKILKVMLIEAQKKKKKRSKVDLVLKMKDRTGRQEEFVVPLYDWEKFRKVSGFMNAAIAAPEILAQTILQQTVNTWEQFLAQYVSARLSTDLALIDSELTVQYEELRHLKTISAIHDFFVNKVVEGFLRKSTNEQLKFLKNTFNVDLSNEFSELKELKEVILRRHSIVHCNSVVTHEYYQQASKLGMKPPTLGSKLFSDPPYVFHAWDLFFAAGTIVSFILNVNYARKQKIPELEESANQFVLNASHEALKIGRPHASRMILENILSRKISTEWEAKALQINMALTYKLLNRNDDCKTALNKIDWDAASSDFQAPVAMLKEEYDKAFRIVKAECKKDSSNIKSLREWVIFAPLREQKGCKEFIDKFVGENENAETFKVPQIDFHDRKVSSRQSIKELYEILTQINSDSESVAKTKE